MPMRTLQKKWGGKEMVLDHQKIEVKLQCPRRSIGHGVQGSVSFGTHPQRSRTWAHKRS